MDKLSLYEINILKEEHKDHRLVYFNIFDSEYVFRTLTFDEFERISRLSLDENELYEVICETTVLHPKSMNFSQAPAGLASEIGPYLADISGFGENGTEVVVTTYETYKQLMETSKYSAIATIIAAMNTITVDEIEGWPWDKVIKYVAIAESSLRLMGVNLEMIKPIEEDNPVEDDKELELTPLEETTKYHMSGIDPIIMYGQKGIDDKIIDFPLIGGLHWDREDVVNAIRGQIRR